MRSTRPPRILTSRLGTVAAVMVGFGVGALGFAAAHDDDPVRSVTSPTVVDGPSTTSGGPVSTVDDGPSTTSGGPVSTVVDGPSTTSGGPVSTVDDGPSTTSGGPVSTVVDGPSTTSGGPVSTVVDGPSTTLAGPVSTVVDGPSTTLAGPVSTVDDGPSTTTGGPSTTIASALPDPFTTTYTSSGGSIQVTWSGTEFRLDSVSPAPGFHAEIESRSWDRVRVDFESDGDDARIEVRINDGALRVRVD